MMIYNFVIPYYDRKDLLERCLQAIDGQDFDRTQFEVIVIDDGSDERLTRSFLESFQCIVRYVYCPRTAESGASFARNQGIARANGQFIIFLDCDIVIPSTYLTDVYHVGEMTQFDESYIQMGFRKRLKKSADNSASILEHEPYEADMRYAFCDALSYNFQSLKTAWNLLYSHNFIVSRSLIAKVGGFDMRFCGWGVEDNEFGYRLHKNGGKFIYNPRLEVYHLWHPFTYDEKKDHEWKVNMVRFMDKFCELEVALLKIFITESIPNNECWLEQLTERFVQYETNVLDKVYGIAPITEAFLELNNPSVEQLHSLLSEDTNKNIYVRCSLKKSDLILNIQTDPKCKDIVLKVER